VFGKQIVLRGVESETQNVPFDRPAVTQPALDAIQARRLTQADMDDDFLNEDAARTDDDVVRDAFRFLDGSDQDLEEDEIVYMR
jgi:hypothetical protein